MTVRVLLALLCAALVSIAAACGGGSSLDRDSSAKGIVKSIGGTTTPQASPGSIIYFYDGGSSSTGGPIVKWEWDFGNGWEDASQTQGLYPHVFDIKGNVQVQFRATDSAGNTGTDKVLIKIKEKYDNEPIFMVFGVDESDSFEQGGGARLRYHQWRWRTLYYDPDNIDIRESPTLAVSKVGSGDPDFDLLRVIASSGDPDFDFCGIDIDGDGTGDDLDGDKGDDDPSLKRVLVLPHVLEVSGRCIANGNPHEFGWAIEIEAAGKKHTKTGHVTLLK